MRLLLDTNVAILVRDGDEYALTRFDVSVDDVVISLVTLIELEGGITSEIHCAVERRHGLERLLDWATVMPVDRFVVDAYADILRHTGFSRRKILDRLIASTAIVHDLTLVTTNGDDFRDIPGLALEVWPVPAQ